MSEREPMNQVVARFLEGKALPERRFAALNDIARRSRGFADARGGAAHGVGGFRRSVVAAAAAVAAIGVALAVLQQGLLAPSAADVHQRIADEVATNHIELKTLEVSSGDMAVVRRFFEPLNFQLIESSLLENTSWRMAGGRLCTIQGEAAAQLRMHDDRGDVQTVYQVPYSPAVHHDVPDVLRDERPTMLYSHGLRVRLWRERGLLFATVSQ